MYMPSFRSMLYSVSGLPTPLRVGIALLCGASIVGALYMLTGSGQTIVLVMVGIFVVMLLLVGLRALRKRLRKRKAAPMEREIVGNTSATPQAVSAAASRAQLDDLRSKFEDGVEKFRAAGKDLYTLPWYLIVGEPGSGKTEAIRHCNVGFPPGLHDQFQGAGGTINMNWWFTNHAVILDTAGRLLFEEVPAGGSSEWQEFLRLLRKHRPNCPINGMVLVIPADSLIKDTADEIERKGAKIAQQLDQIQRTMGVRFPVFVMITKCDLVNGFREFFDGVTDPQMQHQIMGWSNPAPLDEPFDPEMVDRHLETVQARIRRRRLGVLLDPVHTDDPSERRTDQVDALFDFPQGLSRITSRLKRYLQMVFVAGAWSAKPLFLRGIYFTSSMREGEALDAELAEVLGVPVESLPEGRVWERERAYFLRDLFMNKVFREKGLVTRASNAKRHQRRRRLVVLLSAIIAVLAMGFFTWWYARALQESIGRLRDYTVAAARGNNWDQGKWLKTVVSPEVEAEPGVVPEYGYTGRTPVRVGLASVPLSRFHGDLLGMNQQPIAIPWVYRPVATLTSDLDAKRRRAERVLFEASVLKPLVEAARRKIPKVGAWSDQATEALLQLLRLETYALKLQAPSGETPQADGALVELEPLIRFVLMRDVDAEGEGPYQDYLADEGRQHYQRTMDWLYSAEGGCAWPPAVMAVGARESRDVILKAVGRFVEHWSNPKARKAEGLEKVLALRIALDGFQTKEEALLAIDDGYPPSDNKPDARAEYLEVKKRWAKAYEDLAAAAASLDLTLLAGKRIDQVYAEQATRSLEAVQGAFGCLPRAVAGERPGALAGVTDEKARSEILSGQKGLVQEIDKRLKQAMDDLVAETRKAEVAEALQKLDANVLAELEVIDEDLRSLRGRRNWRTYEVRLEMYRVANAELVAADTPAKTAELPEALAGVDGAVDKAVARVNALVKVSPDAFRFGDAGNVSTFALSRLARPGRSCALIQAAIDQAPENVEQVEQSVAERAAGAPKDKPVVPLTSLGGGKYEAKYQLDAARKTLAGWKIVADVLQGTQRMIFDRSALQREYDRRGDAYRGYIQRYLEYWSVTIPGELRVAGMTWDELRKALGGMRAAAINTSLKAVSEDILSALAIDVPAGPGQEELAKRIESARDLAGKAVAKAATPSFLEECKGVVVAWGDLGSDANAARETILDQTPFKLQQEYFLPVNLGASPVERYWVDVTLGALRTLADASQSKARQAFTALRGYGRFPLAAPGPSDSALTPQEVERARVLLGQIVGRTTATTPTATIRAGKLTSRDEIDRELQRLRALELRGTEKQWVQAVQGLLACLPPDNETYACEVSILPQKEQVNRSKELPGPEKGRLALEWWAKVTLYQGRSEKGWKFTTSAELQKLGAVQYPGAELALRFYKHPSDTAPDRVVTVAGPWAALRLLHSGQAGQKISDTVVQTHYWDRAQRPESGESWLAAVTVKDDQGQYRALWVRLQFKKPLPIIQDWPKGGG